LKKFSCSCGQTVFFENTQCYACGSILAYDFEKDTMRALTQPEVGVYQSRDKKQYKLCKNYEQFGVCNVCVIHDSPSEWCVACRLNQTIPNLDNPENIQYWKKLELAKRRLIRTLLSLNLPLESMVNQQECRLRFAFLEDQRRNPDVPNEFVYTGHNHGLITVNLDEADDVSREQVKVTTGENYRTPLGHLRHESGHYYFDVLLANSQLLDGFRMLFGDESVDYKQSLDNYYSHKQYQQWQNDFISRYAQAHPLEDWAECWAHYLHMHDTLETARCQNIIEDISDNSLDESVADWSSLIVIMNELNRSMGLNDTYPFVLSDEVIRKLNFVHQVIDPTG
tara:strand:- start:21985 stop:22998 length:1014 start_codon:yes stop_codon:yes gene_type:complete